MGVCGQHHTGRFAPGKDPVPIIQEAGWAPGLVWKGVEISPPPGFDPRTLQAIASHYTDWAIPAHPGGLAHEYLCCILEKRTSYV